MTKKLRRGVAMRDGALVAGGWERGREQKTLWVPWAARERAREGAGQAVGRVFFSKSAED
ncbi:hypothetical protein RirG_031690 [Rhizophagus irregularis DAOM 197198w]|uniref:Uncharacterized protein n=1 Tax=Rhizophagus irregularis (strain DAOM 197198w) TaxID=1432141 RepID=A0A015NBN3_RHIIW|nr:hypothetical protein RirG_031690 [Rhizophagus irregularis DAOM 197198w]